MKTTNKYLIGIFDSGIGGVPVYQTLLSKLKRLKLDKSIKLRYLGDTKNFPYGTKTFSDLSKIVAGNIYGLIADGCDIIGIACNTASYVYEEITHHKITPNVLPILEVSAKVVSDTSKGNVYVICSNFSANNKIYSKTIAKYNEKHVVSESGEQTLINAIESKNNRVIDKEVKRIVKGLPKETDTLVLGCTHFSHVAQLFDKECVNQNINVNIIDPTDAMANELLKKIKEINHKKQSNKDHEIYFSGNEQLYITS